MVNFKIVLFQPEIPGNTGTIGRTCVALGIDLYLIGPLGFDLSLKAVRRAGLDYWQHLTIHRFASFSDFLQQELCPPQNLFFFSRFAEQIYYHARFTNDSYLIFGSETQGLPAEILHSYPGQSYQLPTFSDKIRSLNLANVVTTVAFEAVRQIHFPC